MKEVRGDLIALALAGHFDVIVHGCNCQCVMGGGIARVIRTVFPQAYYVDQLTSRVRPEEKLGAISFTGPLVAGAPLWIVNGYTQLEIRSPPPHVDPEALRSVMKKVKEGFSGLSIGYPMIGAGLDGGNWDELAPIIDEELAGEDHTLVIYANIHAETSWA